MGSSAGVERALLRSLSFSVRLSSGACTFLASGFYPSFPPAGFVPFYREAIYLSAFSLAGGNGLGRRDTTAADAFPPIRVISELFSPRAVHRVSPVVRIHERGENGV